MRSKPPDYKMISDYIFDVLVKLVNKIYRIIGSSLNLMVLCYYPDNVVRMECILVSYLMNFNPKYSSHSFTTETRILYFQVLTKTMIPIFEPDKTRELY